MWTFSQTVLAMIAVVAQRLLSDRPLLFEQPSVELERGSTYLSPMHGTCAVDVVDAEKH
jgi:hypothetical protein